MYTYIVIVNWVICVLTANIGAGMAVFASVIQDNKTIKIF